MAGFDIDLAAGIIKVPQTKLNHLKTSLQWAVCQSAIPAKAVASITGKIISMSLALGDIARLRTWALYADIHSRLSWQGTITLTADAKEELNFWLDSIDEFNSRHVWRALSAVRVVYSDASSTGFGSYVVQHGEHIAHGQWSLQETQKSSTWRELRAVSHTLKVFAGMLSNHRVR